MILVLANPKPVLGLRLEHDELRDLVGGYARGSILWTVRNDRKCSREGYAEQGGGGKLNVLRVECDVKWEMAMRFEVGYLVLRSTPCLLEGAASAPLSRNDGYCGCQAQSLEVRFSH